eukprot:310400-Prymnesium_polylepis.1
MGRRAVCGWARCARGLWCDICKCESLVRAACVHSGMGATGSARVLLRAEIDAPTHPPPTTEERESLSFSL